LTNRWDETWHRLREWTNGQGPSERLAAQLLLHEHYEAIDPSHPLGGKDGGRDAVCQKDGLVWSMAAYFPRGQQDFDVIKKKFLAGVNGVRANKADAMAFVTNQELRLAERKALEKAAGNVRVELFHLERITAILDKPEMANIRKQFLGIDFTEEALRQEVASTKNAVLVTEKHLEGLQTGGDSFCYLMLYNFDLGQNIARDFVIIRRGEYPLYDVRIRIRDMDANRDVMNRAWGEINSPADYLIVRWSLPASIYYRVSFHARNGSWNQDLILSRSTSAQCWLAATRVLGKSGEARFEHIDNGFIDEFGSPGWRE
jgi:hypothetical protein